MVSGQSLSLGTYLDSYIYATSSPSFDRTCESRPRSKRVSYKVIDAVTASSGTGLRGQARTRLTSRNGSRKCRSSNSCRGKSCQPRGQGLSTSQTEIGNAEVYELLSDVLLIRCATRGTLDRRSKSRQASSLLLMKLEILRRPRLLQI